MKDKPHITKILKIMQLKAQAAGIHEEIDQCVDDLKSEHGAQRFDYDLEELPMCELSLHLFAHELKQNGQYIKFEIVDNVEKMKLGESVWKSTSIKPITFLSGSLKKCPQSLKE